MRITILFMGQARLAAGCERMDLDVPPGSSAAAAVRQAAACGEALRAFLFHPDGRPRRSVLLITGSCQLSWDSSDPLEEGTSITVLPPIAGGVAPLTEAERALYEWQLDVPGFGEAGQAKLKAATVLVSRVGGLGGPVAYQLAAAGVGHLLLAHAGNTRASDLNRQILMTHAGIGQPRVESAARRLAELNPHVRITPVPENVGDANADRLVGQADLVVDCAPLFAERFAMNRAAVRLGKPMVECAVYELQAQLTTIVPGRTPCLECLYPEDPPAWKRRFPVFGAVAGSLGCLAAMEAIKVLSGLGEPLAGRLLMMDLRGMTFQVVELHRRPDCPVCGRA